ncbi:unnamed protein product [Arctia plantaginis]|uniref:Amino acid transporter transmembrane domain-containing protein n=1 Tax=Arctia plantaginis TaxID=874455 RepID=A0A8S0ZAK2_ARCPL|nr:unnamed protein product [Arctia plantaginis]CAB3249555.1 unnamed protein product [Arctia plantaginis]
MSHYTANSVGEPTGGLSVLFTVLCVVDLFGVFPVITLPKSVISCGIYAIPLVLSVFGLQLYTAVLLGKSWLLAQEITPYIRDKNRFPYAAVAELAFGSPAKKLVTFLIDAAIFGSGVPNLIIAAQTLQIFWWKISGGMVRVTYCVWMAVLALLLCPVTWLGSPKDMKPLAVSSVFIVSTVAVTTWTCIVGDDVSPPSAETVMDLKPDIQNYLIAYGILAFQFDIHPMLLTLQVDMKDSRKINLAVLGGFGFTGLLFTVTTVLAGLRYGNDVNNNILQTLPPTIPLYMVALLVTLQLCLSCAVSNSPLFQHIEDYLKVPRNFCFQRCIVRSSILLLAVLLAEAVPRFDLVMGLVGSTLTGPLMFVCPPLFFLRLCYMKSQMRSDIKGNRVRTNDATHTSTNAIDLPKNPLISLTQHTTYNTFENATEIVDEYGIKWYDVALALVVMIIGMLATLLATYSSWSDSIEYASFSPPCLMNASEAARAFLQAPALNV